MDSTLEPLLGRVIEGESAAELARLPEGCIDLIFADPPYNLQLRQELFRPDRSRVEGVDAAWDRFDDFADYDRFCREWLEQCRRVLHPDGAIWVIGSYHNIYRIGALLQDLGFWILNYVVWRKANPMPNFRGKRLTNAHETLIWAARSDRAKPVFNYTAAKSLNEDLQMRSDWFIPICGGQERLKVAGRKLHPTQKPEALLHRVLMLSSQPGQVILDPFFGTGTTGAVAKRLGRRFIGIERDPAYAEAARARIAAIEPLSAEAVAASSEPRQAERVPFGHLVERGMIVPGEVLFDSRRRFTARVRADGSLISDRAKGSIHQVAAFLQNLPACNGWGFWHVDRQGRPIPIDALRQAARDFIGG